MKFFGKKSNDAEYRHRLAEWEIYNEDRSIIILVTREFYRQVIKVRLVADDFDSSKEISEEAMMDADDLLVMRSIIELISAARRADAITEETQRELNIVVAKLRLTAANRHARPLEEKPNPNSIFGTKGTLHA